MNSPGSWRWRLSIHGLAVKRNSLKVERQIESRSGMRERTDADPVDAGFG